MARLARAVFPGHPHHVTQRGNGRAQTFFDDADYAFYLELLGAHCRAAAVEVWAWVLMPNHVHLILTPSDADGLRRALAAVHRRYAGRIHARLQRTGHFWQGRFGCVAMDEEHLGAALRYVALNPVRARLAGDPRGWRWSSVHAHLDGAEDGVTCTRPILIRYPDLAAWIAAEGDEDASRRLKRAETIGRPIGNPDFLTALESGSGRTFTPGKPGRRQREFSALSP